MGRSILLVLTCALVWGCTQLPSTVRSNVIVVCIDSLRTDRLAPYGGSPTVSPTMAAIAAEGVVFENAFTVASWTKPSVASLLTGLFPSQHGLIASHSNRADLLPAEVTTLAETMHAAGYRTAAFVDNIHLKREQSALDQGFEVYVQDAGSAREIINGFAAWISHEASRPFFAYLHLLEPHWPYTPLPPPAGRPVPDHVALQRMQWDFDGGRWPLLRDAVNHHGLVLSGDELSTLATLYDGEIFDTDAALAALIQVLRTRGILDDTLLVVTADHGEGFLDHGRLDHGYGPYDELLRIPLLFRFPRGSPGGRRILQPVQIADVTPTIFDAIGVEYPAHGGRSLLTLINDAETPNEGGVIAEEVHGSVTITALRTHRYKYIRTEDGITGEQTAAKVVLPANLEPGVRVRIEGVIAHEAFIADEIKRVAPGDKDCELTVPLNAIDKTSREIEIAGARVDLSALGKKEHAALVWRTKREGAAPVVWAHLQGNVRDGILVVDDADRLHARKPELEIEGVVESVDINAKGARLGVCSWRVFVDADARWKDFEKKRDDRTDRPAPVAMTVRHVREELYDLVRDPKESTNIAGQEPDLTARLANRLAARRERLRMAVESPDTRSVELSKEVRDRLEALGYTE